MNFFTNKNDYNTVDINLDSFSLIDLLTSVITSSNPSVCLLDPISKRLLKEILPSIKASILNMVKLSLLIGADFEAGSNEAIGQKAIS